MNTGYGHLTYCSNIHPGEHWQDHFNQLRQYIPLVKKQVAADKPFGIGLRLSNVASLELRKEENLIVFQQWLAQEDCYVFTINGFPYGGFHGTRVKDSVHAPDWTTSDRVQYTIRLAQILAALLPEELDGGISTSPLSYQFWHREEDLEAVYQKATWNLLQVVIQLVQIKRSTGKAIHLDIEPEPDGLLGESDSFFDWYEKYLLPMGIACLEDRFSLSRAQAEASLKEHVQLCYDVCHFAINYEDHAAAVNRLQSLGIKAGKIQISAALRASLSGQPQQRAAVIEAFKQFDEPTYLHQVVARQSDGLFKKYRDMADALKDAADPSTAEWRAHFHVPLFVDRYDVLQSTQNDIKKVLSMHLQQPMTTHLEVETYTWEVLPPALQVPLADSIVRELRFVLDLLPVSDMITPNSSNNA